MSEAASGNLYEAVLAGLAGAAGDAEPGLPPARSSAAVVPWRRSGRSGAGVDERGRAGDPVHDGGEGSARGVSGVEVFWVKRGEALPFMGGWHAFPGGGLARSDAEIAVIPPAARVEPAALAAPAAEPRPQPTAADDLPPGILACAIRELFEETGILLARPAAGSAAAPGPARA